MPFWLKWVFEWGTLRQGVVTGVVERGRSDWSFMALPFVVVAAAGADVAGGYEAVSHDHTLPRFYFMRHLFLDQLILEPNKFTVLVSSSILPSGGAEGDVAYFKLPKLVLESHIHQA